MEELKLAAQERGLMVIRKRRTGPVMVLESRTGKSIGSFAGIDEAMAAVLKVAPLPIEQPPEAVGWHWDVEYTELPKNCPNGWGPTCLCLDTTAIYLCAAPPCRARAGCQGACQGHYAQLKVLGDLTELAIAKTAALAEDGEFDLLTLPLYPRKFSLKIPSPTDRGPAYLSPGQITEVTSGAIGMTIRWTGTEYLLVDKDGKILDRVASKAELFEEEEPEEPVAAPVIQRRTKKKFDAE